MNRWLNLAAATAMILSLFYCGCSGIRQKYPDKHQFAIQACRSGPPVKTAPRHILRVSRFKVSPMYQDKGLVYRDSNSKYQNDFYNEYLVYPGPMITTRIANWLSDTGMFKRVYETPGKVLPDLILEGAVTSLYGDFRSEKAPKAVLEIEFFLVDAEKPRSDIVFQRRICKIIPLEGDTAEDLVEGFNIALTRILTEFESGLHESGVPWRALGR